jgi:hypothetical protein
MSEPNMNEQISNEQMQLVNILNRMYSDNIRQINSMTNSINNIRNTNIQIRNSLIQLLNRPTINRNNEISNSVFIDNIIDNIQNYTNRRNTDPFLNRNIINTNTNRQQERSIRFVQNFLQPVEVFPTQSQIEAATRNVQYCNILDPINRSCPISLENFNDTDLVSVIRYCGHIFKSEQLRIWFRTNCRCPVCRYDIRNYNSDNNQNTDSVNQTDISNNFVEEHEDPTNNTMSTISTYLDLFFENGVNSLSESLINEYTNIDNSVDANALLTFLNSSIRRRR